LAIFFTQGTLNPASTTLANDIRVAWKGAVTTAIANGKTNFAVVDDGYTTGGLIRSVITNTSGWAMEIYNSTTTSLLPVQFIFGQSYTVATHTLNNQGFGSVVGSFTPLASGLSGSNTATTAGTVHTAKTFNAVNTQSAWTAHFNDDYVIFSVKVTNTTGYWLYAGRFSSLTANPALGTDTYPFGMFGTAGNVLLSSHGNGSTAGIHGPAITSIYQDSAPALASSNDFYSLNTNKAKLSPWYIYRQSITPNTNNYTLGWRRGKLFENIAYHGFPNNASIGATVAIGTTTYMYVGNSGNFTTATPNGYAMWAAIN